MYVEQIVLVVKNFWYEDEEIENVFRDKMTYSHFPSCLNFK